MRFLTNLNLLSNELQNAVIQVLATSPASGKIGQIYYNSADKALMQYDGTQWKKVGVVYQQSSTTGAVVTGLDDTGNVTTTNVTGLTLTGYTPVEGGYVTAGMSLQEAMQAMDTAIKNAVAGDGGASGDFKSDGTVPMSGNLYMNGNNIMGVKSISNTDSGMAIESEVSLNNHKITDLLNPTADQDAATKAYVDGHSLLGDDGKIDSDLNMNEHGIVNAHRISTDGPAPLYIGSTIEATGTNAPRLTGSNDGTAAFVKADTQATYVPVSVGAPTSTNHATTKEYVDGKTGAIQASALLKSGGTMVGKLKLTADATEPNDAVDKAYVDAILPAFTAADNDKVLGIVNGALAWVAKA